MTIQVFSKPNCVQCTATKRWLTQKGAEFTEVDLTEDDAAMAMVKELGYAQAPVVITDTDHWSGFNPGKLEEALA